MEAKPMASEPTEVAAEDPRLRLIDRALKRFQYRPDALIEVLHAAQETYGFLGEEVLGYVARQLKVPESQVFGVATFYHFFTLRPRGEHSCIVCTGTACYVKGAGEIVAALEETFAIHPGQTTADGRLSLGTARCLGNCSLAPMLTVDARVLGRESAPGAVAKVQAVLGAGSAGGEEGA
jgi:bidirectional [NiFe] hydrogenase diaphorase subunit